MFTVTFYSFKGGVGRSMALVNVAYNLARDGKKVLIVDFDLEAPGLTTFQGCESAKGKLGVVEYVIEYLEAGSSPDVCNFIQRCHFEETLQDDIPAKNGELHILPAGNLESAYGSRYGQIDWRLLYEEHQGFYFMEDLKSQWEDMGFDYVLIDSRTGHTDVSGICTRHLPDVVVNVFFPNEQNLHGLKQVVSEIRDNSASKSVELLFVASRVPNLDDEEGIIKALLERFKVELSYNQRQFARVHHYDSLALLEQKVFSASRPRTRLAREYGSLTDIIVTRNVADQKGAILFLDSIISDSNESISGNLSRSSNSALYPSGIVFEKLGHIRDFHAHNPSVMYSLAFTYYTLRQLEDAASAIDAAVAVLDSPEMEVDQKFSPSAGLIHGFRSRVYRELGHGPQAVGSAQIALSCNDLAAPVLLDVIRMLIEEAPQDIPEPQEVPAINNMPPDELFDFAKRLDFSRASVQYGAKVTKIALNRYGQLTPVYGIQSVLTFMGGGMFEDASKIIGLYSNSTEAIDFQIAFMFNWAMVQWALSKAPIKSEFERVAYFVEEHKEELHDRSPDANYNQCLAVTYGVLGAKSTAREYLEKALTSVRAKEKREFSCWSYRELTRGEYERDCAEIKEFIKSTMAMPRFIQEAI